MYSVILPSVIDFDKPRFRHYTRQIHSRVTQRIEELNMTLATSKRTSSHRRQQATVALNSILKKKDREQSAYRRKLVKYLRCHLRRRDVVNTGEYVIVWTTTHFLLQKHFRWIDCIIKESVPSGWTVSTHTTDTGSNFTGWRFTPCPSIA